MSLGLRCPSNLSLNTAAAAPTPVTLRDREASAYFPASDELLGEQGAQWRYVKT